MLYLSHTPRPPLSDFVDCLWLYSDAPGHLQERIVPSGTIELVINLCDDELRIDAPVWPQHGQRFSGALVSGAYGAFFVIDARQQASILGVHFKPGGAFPFLGVPAGELADRHVDLRTLWGRAAIELRERLCAAARPGQRFRQMEEALAARLARAPARHGAVSIALEAFGRTEAGTTVREVARRVDLSERRFIQVFTAQVGQTPKLFQRVRRRTTCRWPRVNLSNTGAGRGHRLRREAGEGRRKRDHEEASAFRTAVHRAGGGREHGSRGGGRPSRLR